MNTDTKRAETDREIALAAQRADELGRKRLASLPPPPTHCACGKAFGFGEPCAKKTKDFEAPALVCRDCMFGRAPC